MSNKPINSMKDTEKFRRMTEQLRLTHTDEEVANYLRWILSAASPGKLRVEEEVELIQAEPLVPMWFCSHCDWRNAPSHYTFCPGCGNKIKLTKQ